MDSNDESKTPKANRSGSSSKLRARLERKVQPDDIGGPTLRSRIAKEEMTRMFKTYTVPHDTSEEDLKQEMGRFFTRHFGSDMNRSRMDNTERDQKMKKRTTETIEAINECKKIVESVDIIDTRTHVSGDANKKDDRNLQELLKELSKMKNRSSSGSSSGVPLNRPDIDDITIATNKLLHDLERISKTYGSLK